MSKVVEIPISDPFIDANFTVPSGETLRFPQKCAYCMGMPEKTIKLKTILRDPDRNKVFVCQPPVPYCNTHKREARRNAFLLGAFSFTPMILLLMILLPLMMWSNTFVVKISGNLCFDLILLAFFCGVLMVVMAKLGKAILYPLFKSIRDQSLFGIFDNSGSLGAELNSRITKNQDQVSEYFLIFKYSNERYADEFNKLNCDTLTVPRNDSLLTPAINDTGVDQT